MSQTHGMRHTPEWKAWRNMKTRCSNQNIEEYHRYGGRGIKVCEIWWNSFEQFYQDMGSRPSSGHTLDRIDNDGDYEPGNCRWITRKEQAQNRESNRRLTLDGITRTMAEWADACGVKADTIGRRLRLGWSAEKALNTPVSRGLRRSRQP
jgi:hypothetical protein